MERQVAFAVLASFVVVPTVLWIFRCRLSELFRVSSSRRQSAITTIVIGVHLIAAATWLTFRLTILGESVMTWASLVALAYVWYRVIVVVCNRWTDTPT